MVAGGAWGWIRPETSLPAMALALFGTYAAFVATAAVVALDVAIPPGSIPLDVTTGRLLSSLALLLAAAVGGCVFSLRRVLRVDPASAIG